MTQERRVAKLDRRINAERRIWSLKFDGPDLRLAIALRRIKLGRRGSALGTIAHHQSTSGM